jgi:phenylpropionate dioxygenase-like ring-hydroxylating dioxygenase large terminal subunit
MTPRETPAPQVKAQEARIGEGFLEDFWYVAALSSALKPGRTYPLTLLARRVALARTPLGRVFALSDRCPHRSVPLSAGRLHQTEDGDTLVCPYHGWRFNTEGVCTGIPALDREKFEVSAIRIPRYTVAESQGLVWIWFGEDQPHSPPPLFPDIASRPPLAVVEIEYPVHIDHANLGLVDPAHVPVVHRQWWWRSAMPRKLKTKAFVPSELGFTMQAHTPQGGRSLYRVLGETPVTEIVFRLPGLRWEHVRGERRSFLALSIMTPLTARTTRMLQIVWTDIPLARLLASPLHIAMRHFLREDAAILAAQSIGLADSTSAPLWVGDADQQGRWYVQLKQEWKHSRLQRRPFANPVVARSLSWRS